MTQRRFWFPLALVGWQYWMPLLFGGAVLTAAAALLLPIWAAVIPAVMTLACLLFFRDPLRRVSSRPDVMVSPADGVVTEIAVVESKRLSGDVLRVSIFLSVLDVHLNRSPCRGTVHSVNFEAGRFLDARHPESGVQNQSNNLVINTSYGPIVVRQIVGAIARRIICPVREGHVLDRGECFGMIAFGSRTELLVSGPERWTLCVKVGDKVRAGSSIILECKAEQRGPTVG
ncbi:MAG: phosphatidylserine decarboxylase [Phycisphaerae bacterium]